MRLNCVTPPSLEPISLSELKTHLYIDSVSQEPAPGAPTVALAGAGAGNVNTGAHRYRVTFVTADGQTEGGDISAVVTTSAGDGKVSVSAISIGGSAVTQRKIYRTAANGSTYLLLTTIDNNMATTFSDNIADASLGAECPSTNTTTDPTLTRIIKEAREEVENDSDRKLITQTWDYFPQRWPSGDSGDRLRIPFGQLQSITSVKWKDTEGTETTLTATTDYLVETNGDGHGFIVLPYGGTWPSESLYPSNPISIRFVCGWTTAALVSSAAKGAMLLRCSKKFENRGEDVIGATVYEDRAYYALIWKIPRLFWQDWL